MIDYLVYFIILFISGLFGYKFNKIIQENKDAKEEIELFKKLNNINSLSDDDINKLHDKYE